MNLWLWNTSLVLPQHMFAEVVQSVATQYDIIHSRNTQSKNIRLASDVLRKVLRHHLFTVRDAPSSLRSRDAIPGELLVSHPRGILPRGTLRRAPPYAVSITAVYR
jgi:hypothetical protein